MKQKSRRIIPILLTFILVLSAGMFAVRRFQAENTREITEDYLIERFNIYIPHGAQHVGYIFQLAEDADVCFEGNINIWELRTPVNLFTAHTLQDIIDSGVDINLILYIEPNFVGTLD